MQCERRENVSSATKAHRRFLAIGAAVLLFATGPGMVVPAAAVDPATLELGKEIMGWENGASVTPGQTFGYTLELSCNNSGIGGCLDAVLMDPIPEGLILDGDASSISVTGRGVASKVTIEAPQTVRIDLLSPIDGGIGMPHGTTITAVVPVRVDPNLGPSANGIPLLNTATATASNAPSVTDDFTVVPEVPIVLDSTASKSFDPTSGLAAAGTKRRCSPPPPTARTCPSRP